MTFLLVDRAFSLLCIALIRARYRLGVLRDAASPRSRTQEAA